MAILRMVYFGLTWIYQIRFDLVLLPLQSTPKFTVPGKRCTHAPSGGTHPWSHCAPWSCPLRFILTDLMGSYWAVKSQIHWWISGHPSFCRYKPPYWQSSQCGAWISLLRASRFSISPDTSPNWAWRSFCSSVIFSWPRLGSLCGIRLQKAKSSPNSKKDTQTESKIRSVFGFGGGCFGYFSCLSHDILLK